MRVCSGRPPNYAEINQAFGPLSPSVVFAYGDTIYAARPDELPADLIVHEKVHLRQQREVGGPEIWWRRYIDDPEFRLAQEVEAYRAQLASHSVKRERRQVARRVALDLASSMYGSLVDRHEAWKLLTA